MEGVLNILGWNIKPIFQWGQKLLTFVRFAISFEPRMLYPGIF
jgi:hypothetical protein